MSSLATQCGNGGISRADRLAVRAPISARLKALRGLEDLPTEIRSDEEFLVELDREGDYLSRHTLQSIRRKVEARLEALRRRLAESGPTSAR